MAQPHQRELLAGGQIHHQIQRRALHTEAVRMGSQLSCRICPGPCSVCSTGAGEKAKEASRGKSTHYKVSRGVVRGTGSSPAPALNLHLHTGKNYRSPSQNRVRMRINTCRASRTTSGKADKHQVQANYDYAPYIHIGC